MYWNKDNRGLDTKRKKRKRKKGQIDTKADQYWKDRCTSDDVLRVMFKLKLLKKDKMPFRIYSMIRP